MSHYVEICEDFRKTFKKYVTKIHFSITKVTITRFKFKQRRLLKKILFCKYNLQFRKVFNHVFDEYHVLDVIFFTTKMLNYTF